MKRQTVICFSFCESNYSSCSAHRLVRTIGFFLILTCLSTLNTCYIRFFSNVTGMSPTLSISQITASQSEYMLFVFCCLEILMIHLHNTNVLLLMGTLGCLLCYRYWFTVLSEHLPDLVDKVNNIICQSICFIELYYLSLSKVLQVQMSIFIVNVRNI